MGSLHPLMAVNAEPLEKVKLPKPTIQASPHRLPASSAARSLDSDSVRPLHPRPQLRFVK